jgi:hypothetical protein
MYKTFQHALPKAQGRSEFIIVVNIDIRGFSSFSTVNESPNIAMFIKRFYLQMLNQYFANANFVKPTGDGLLMTFNYDENSLLDVSKTVLTSCYKCLEEFPSFCQNDPMINFSVPEHIGLGVARGTACCLYAEDEILDYSGHLLNLCSRLMELARPSGIVIDGNYMKSVVPTSLQEHFIEQKVYIRGIAESTPITVMSLKDYVEIPKFYMKPIVSEKWSSQSHDISMRELLKISDPKCAFKVKKRPRSNEAIKVTLTVVKQGEKGRTEFDLPFEYPDRLPEPQIVIDTELVKEIVAQNKVRPNSTLTFKIDYVPRT